MLVLTDNQRKLTNNYPTFEIADMLLMDPWMTNLVARRAVKSPVPSDMEIAQVCKELSRKVFLTLDAVCGY